MQGNTKFQIKAAIKSAGILIKDASRFRGFKTALKSGLVRHVRHVSL